MDSACSAVPSFERCVTEVLGELETGVTKALGKFGEDVPEAVGEDVIGAVADSFDESTSRLLNGTSQGFGLSELSNERTEATSSISA